MRALEEQIGGRKLTPMLQQYIEAKRSTPADSILLFRMGDFFELFFDDAVIASRELELTLTSRDKDSTDPIPMAGVPHHAVSSYIARLIERGYTVALCDQVEDPKTAKGIVKRDITRLVTPGTISDLDALDPGAANYLARIVAGGGGGEVVIVLLDLLAGEILTTRCHPEALADELQRMGAREILLDRGGRAAVTAAAPGALESLHAAIREIDDEPPPDDDVRKSLRERFGTDEVDGRPPGTTGAAERWGIESIARFAESTQRRRLRHLMRPRAYQVSDYVILDEATRRNLELRTTLDGRKRGALLWHLDRCRTAMGSRTLAHWLLFPLRDQVAIENRLDMVGDLRGERTVRAAVQDSLAGVRDIERLVGRVAVGRATPRDLGALRDSLAAVPDVQRRLADHGGALGRVWAAVDPVTDVREDLDRALVTDPPTAANDGGIFARGYRDDLDELIVLSTEGHDYLADLERRERERTKIAKLKVRYNKVFGYYIEVSRANVALVPDDYVRRQTLVNAERYITDELKNYETRVLGADERRKAREQELFAELVEEVARHANRLRALSRTIAQTDALASLAQVAEEGRYTRPILTGERVLELRQSRHPVVERLMPGGERFVANDVGLDADNRQLLIVTGPNMAGKSTVMRQVALCTVLAHMGSFVPAKAARIGLCDRVFTRVGASDALGKGHSTFMVEMIETAAILRWATADSLVILDEIGRGTSTFDGVSLAWSVAEDLHDRVGCRALFATHYHELTDLAVERRRIANVSVAVQEEGGRIVFLRRLVDGAANRSYGIEVARLAGLPEHVLRRSREILDNLERGELDEQGLPSLAAAPGRRAKSNQLDLFAAARAGAVSVPAPAPPRPSPVEDALRAIDLLETTPLGALAALDRLKGLLPAAGNARGDGAERPLMQPTKE